MCEYLRHLPEVSAHRISSSPPSQSQFRKKILVKIFTGPVWEKRLLEFVDVFTNRRKEFEFALTIHTAVGVDEANFKLNAVDQRTVELDQKYVPRMEVIHPTTDHLG